MAALAHLATPCKAYLFWCQQIEPSNSSHQHQNHPIEPATIFQRMRYLLIVSRLISRCHAVPPGPHIITQRVGNQHNKARRKRPRRRCPPKLGPTCFNCRPNSLTPRNHMDWLCNYWSGPCSKPYPEFLPYPARASDSERVINPVGKIRLL